MTARIIEGDCVEAMRAMPEASVDAVVTDPPAGIAFMSKHWDSNRGGAEAWIAWLAEVMAEARRVLKPGGHAVVWALPRTSHWTGTAIERAGFEVRDCLTHHFGSGFPKSLDVSKAIDKAAGAERRVVGESRSNGRALKPGPSTYVGLEEHGPAPPVTAPATPDAEKWQGWGTALKPSTEFWWLARKPLISTVAANVLAFGTGSININGCRVQNREGRQGGGRRWPSNLVLSHSPDCVLVGTRRVKSNAQSAGEWGGDTKVYGEGIAQHRSAGDGTEEVEAYECVEGCPVSHLGGPARFFPTFRYVAKASRAERNLGLTSSQPSSSAGNACPDCGGVVGGALRNSHPT